MWVSEPTPQFLFKPKRLIFPNGANEEILYCRAALYDVKSLRRISTFVEFDVKVLFMFIEDYLAEKYNFFVFNVLVFLNFF